MWPFIKNEPWRARSSLSGRLHGKSKGARSFAMVLYMQTGLDTYHADPLANP
jgi:hypothetical protein